VYCKKLLIVLGYDAKVGKRRWYDMIRWPEHKRGLEPTSCVKETKKREKSEQIIRNTRFTTIPSLLGIPIPVEKICYFCLWKGDIKLRKYSFSR